MASVTGIAGGVMKGGGGLFGKLLKIKLAYIFVIIIFIQAISLGISNGGGIEIINSLGERFLNITQDLQSISLEIINSGAIFNGYWHFLSILWNLFSNVYLIYLWIKLFDWLWGKSPWSNESEGFKNLSFAIGSFLLLQIFYLFLFSVPLEGQTYFDLFKSPITAIVDFFKAVVLIFSSISFEKVVESGLNVTNISNLNVCLNPSGCII